MPTELARLLEERIEQTSQRAVANDIGISPSTLSRVLDDQDINEKTISKLSDYFHVSSFEIFRMKHMPRDEDGLPPGVAYDASRLIASMLNELPDEIKGRLISHFTNMIKTELEFHKKLGNRS